MLLFKIVAEGWHLKFLSQLLSLSLSLDVLQKYLVVNFYVKSKTSAAHMIHCVVLYPDVPLGKLDFLSLTFQYQCIVGNFFLC